MGEEEHFVSAKDDNYTVEKEDMEIKDKEGDVERTKKSLSFLEVVLRKKLPFVRGEVVDEWQKNGKTYIAFSDKLMGDVGRKAIFMPTPGQLPFAPTGGTLPISITPCNVTSQ